MSGGNVTVFIIFVCVYVCSFIYASVCVCVYVGFVFLFVCVCGHKIFKEHKGLALQVCYNIVHLYPWLYIQYIDMCYSICEQMLDVGTSTYNLMKRDSFY